MKPDRRSPTTTSAARAVIFFLGVFALGGLSGVIWLLHEKVSGEAVALVSGLTGTALGALGGLLSQTGAKDVPVIVRSREDE
jgi:hypothetical protein